MNRTSFIALASPIKIKSIHFSSSSKRFLSSTPRNSNISRCFNGQFEQPQQYLLQLLQSCSKVRSFLSTKALHALTITMVSFMDQPMFLNNNIMALYLSTGEIFWARQVFDEMELRNVVSYNTMISGYSRESCVDEAWELFNQMRGCDFRATPFTFGGLLSCDSLDLCRGYQLKALLLKNGLFYADAFSGTALLGLFGRHSCIDEAVQVFQEMPKKSLVTWNSLITLLGNHGFVGESVALFRNIVRVKASLSDSSFVGVISGFQSEQDLEVGEHIHGLVIKMGLNCELSVSNSLINMYAQCSSLCSMEKVFKEAPLRDIVTWNTVIGALAKGDRPLIAFELFMKMSADNVYSNSTTFVSVINSCSNMQVLMHGQFIHTKIIMNSFEHDVFVGSALVNFYAKCNKLDEAYRCFNEIYDKNIVSWNALISAYINSVSYAPLSILQNMLRLAYLPNEFSFSSLLKSSLVFELHQLHCLVIKMGYEQNEYVLSSLITSYAKNGLLFDALSFDTSVLPLSVVPSNVIAGVYNKTGQYQKAQELVSLVEEPDLVSWNILIASCARNGDHDVVFQLFKHMQLNQMYPDNYTFVSLLSVCANLPNLALGSSIHGHIIKTDFTCCDTFVRNVLIDMYGKCGSVKSAEKIFSEMGNKNLISWTSSISALGINGFAHEALKRFDEMELEGFIPDEVSFVVVLSACRHGGLVKQGMALFDKMKMIYGIEPGLDHYNCAVHLLARYGHLKEAEQLITHMPLPPNALIWRSFLDGCERQSALKDQGKYCD